jgi:uncharacterized membrane protein
LEQLILVSTLQGRDLFFEHRPVMSVSPGVGPLVSTLELWKLETLVQRSTWSRHVGPMLVLVEDLVRGETRGNEAVVHLALNSLRSLVQKVIKWQELTIDMELFFYSASIPMFL